MLPDPSLLSAEPRLAMATLVGTTGTSPRRAGAKMWVGESGRVLGTVTIGGCVDARVLASAAGVIASGRPSLEMLALDDLEAAELGLACGGTVEVLVEPVAASRAEDPIVAAYRSVQDEVAAGRAVVVATALDRPTARLVIGDGGRGALAGEGFGAAGLDRAIVAAARPWLEAEESGLATITHDGSDHRVFMEAHAPPFTMLIIGAGEVARSLTVFARELGIQAVVIDGRERFATPERFPAAAGVRVGMPSEIVRAARPTARTAVVLVAHDYKYELPVLREVLRGPAGYIGMLGGRKRRDGIRAVLREDGFDAEDVARIRTPIGLRIGARTTAEIALAIAGEVVAELRTGAAARETASEQGR